MKEVVDLYKEIVLYGDPLSVILKAFSVLIGLITAFLFEVEGNFLTVWIALSLAFWLVIFPLFFMGIIGLFGLFIKNK